MEVSIERHLFWLRIASLVSLCTASFHLHAQRYRYTQYHENYSTPFHKVEAITQDIQGFLWIGSEEGLFRFDGERFEDHSAHSKSLHTHAFSQQFFVNDAGLYQVASNQIISVLETSDSSLFYPNNVFQSSKSVLWISESNHTAARFQNGKLDKFTLSSASKPTKIYFQEDQWGNIWALSLLDGLYVFDEKKQVFIPKLKIKNASSFLISGLSLIHI